MYRFAFDQTSSTLAGVLDERGDAAEAYQAIERALRAQRGGRAPLHVHVLWVQGAARAPRDDERAALLEAVRGLPSPLLFAVVADFRFIDLTVRAALRWAPPGKGQEVRAFTEIERAAAWVEGREAGRAQLVLEALSRARSGARVDEAGRGEAG